jgi:hypothetical protein
MPEIKPDRFAGFVPANMTPVPDAFFDVLAPHVIANVKVDQ